MRDPNLLDELERESTPVSDWGDIGAISTPLSNVETRPGTQHSPSHPRDHSLIYRKCCLLILFVHSPKSKVNRIKN